MGADEEGTLAALKAHRRELIDPKIREHRGRIVKTITPRPAVAVALDRGAPSPRRRSVGTEEVDELDRATSASIAAPSRPPPSRARRPGSPHPDRPFPTAPRRDEPLAEDIKRSRRGRRRAGGRRQPGAVAAATPYKIRTAVGRTCKWAEILASPTGFEPVLPP
jgi:hypothetical protein